MKTSVPQAAHLLNLPLQPTLAQFDLKPERDTQLELGGHIPVGSGDLGFRVWQKNANDLIDDTQVGVDASSPGHQLRAGAIVAGGTQLRSTIIAATAAPILRLLTSSRLNAGCETQLLAPCFGAPSGFTPADHEQRCSITSGILLNNRQGGWFSADAYYGSGLSSDFLSARHARIL